MESKSIVAFYEIFEKAQKSLITPISKRMIRMIPNLTNDIEFDSFAAIRYIGLVFLEKMGQ